MASLVTHPIVPLSIALAAGSKAIPYKLMLLGVIFSMLPDADVIAFRFGIPYGHMLGHRGLSHSLLFAFMLAALCTRLPAFRAHRIRTLLYLFVAAASHGILDAMTTGGKGVGFFIPLTAERYFFTFRPIEVSPLTAREFFTARGREIFTSELQFVWLPSALVVLGGWSARQLFRGRA